MSVDQASQPERPTSPKVAPPLAALDRGINRLEAIARGEPIEAVIHKQIFADEPVLEIEKFSLWYGLKQALYNISMPVPKGKVTAIIGPSGCGKSTLLRCVNRMNDLIDTVKIDGEMRVNSDSIYGPGVDVIELRKRMGMVFQKPNPFPMSIFDNVVYPLMIDGERNKQVIQAKSANRASAGPPCGTKCRTVCTKAPSAFPADSSSGCASPGPSPASPKCCCSTSRARRSTRSPPARSKT
jgi:ABC-type multidrug transport system fused ATPase/permease subunit